MIEIFSSIISGALLAFSSYEVMLYVALFASSIGFIAIGFEPALAALFSFLPIGLAFIAGVATYGLFPYLIIFNGFVLAISIARLFLR